MTRSRPIRAASAAGLLAVSAVSACGAVEEGPLGSDRGRLADLAAVVDPADSADLVDNTMPRLAALIGVVFDRPSGAVERRTRVVVGEARVERFVELRWAGGVGTLTTHTDADEQIRDTRRGRAVVSRLSGGDGSVTLAGRQLVAVLSGARDAMIDLAGLVVMTEHDDGSWRGLGDHGQVSVAAHAAEGMVDSLELGLMSFGVGGGDYWEVVG